MKRSLLFITTLLIALNLHSQEVKVDGIFYRLNQGEQTAETIKNWTESAYTGDIVIPDKITQGGIEYKVTRIGFYTFAESTITSLTLPNTIVELGSFAFQNCTTLESLVVPSSVLRCSCAFDDFVGLKHLTIYSLDHLDLSGCVNLETLRINAAEPDRYMAFPPNAPQTLKVYIPKGSKDGYLNASSAGWSEIGWEKLNPDNIIEDPDLGGLCQIVFSFIGNGQILFNGKSVPKPAFGSLDPILSFTKGEKVELVFVPDDDFVKWSYSVYYKNPGDDKSIIYDPNSNEPLVIYPEGKVWVSAYFMPKDDYFEYATIGDYYCKVFPYAHKATITGNSLVYEQTHGNNGYVIPEMVIPETVNYGDEDHQVTGIGESAFVDAKIDRLVIPSTVTTIESNSFRRFCTKTLEIPSSVRRIYDRSFPECKIDSLLLPESMENLELAEFPFMYIDYQVGGNVAPVTTVKYIRLPKDMTTISWKMFMNVDLSKGIEVPETLTSIGVSAFEQSNLREIHLPEGLTSIGSRAFAVCWSLKTITIPASVKKIPNCLFADTPLDTLYMMSPTPPEAETPLFVDKNSNQDPWAKQPVLVVPQGSKQLYQEAPVWNHFDKIIEFGAATGIDCRNIMTAAPEGYFTLDGRRLTAPQKGINIIRQSDGTTRKVMVK